MAEASAKVLLVFNVVIHPLLDDNARNERRCPVECRANYAILEFYFLSPNFMADKKIFYQVVIC